VRPQYLAPSGVGKPMVGAFLHRLAERSLVGLTGVCSCTYHYRERERV
jgi:hypothetical protein